jgi:RNA polymerase sigma-70 factor (ECF subfamily)
MRSLSEADGLIEQFEEQRNRLRAVAYRMLGSLAEAEDAVQDAWIRVQRAESVLVENPAGWFTTIVARVCLNMLRSRGVRREVTMPDHLPDPVVSPVGALTPEDEAILADSVGLALQVVVDTLPPAERLAFVLHDLFKVPFEQVASIVGRSEGATRQLASRARRRVQQIEPAAIEADVGRQRDIVDAFYGAARRGDMTRLIELLHPGVVLRSDFGTATAPALREVRGARAVAQNARFGAATNRVVHPALVNGSAGAVITQDGDPFAVMAFTIADDLILEIDIVGDPQRIARLAAPVLRAQD